MPNEKGALMNLSFLCILFLHKYTMILTLLLLTKGVASAERTSSQVVLPASVEVAVLLEEEGNSNSQEARPALEGGELINDMFVCFV